MNLLQRIISMVLDWDGGDFRKATERIRRSNDGANDAHLAAIDQHISASRDQHTKIREKSLRENKSIIYVILESQDPAMIDTLTEVQHNECLEYYSAKLAIRDREKIIEVLCRHSPDFTTSIIRDSVAAFEPMIRTIHKQIDLRKHLTAGERFLTDFIATSKPKKDTNGQQKEGVTPPTVEDYVALLRRNRGLLYDYLHDVAKGCPDLRETWRAWARDAVKVFRRNPSADGGIDPNKRHSDSDAGMLNDALQNMFNRLPNDKKETAVRSLDAHADYLHNLEEISTTSMQDILDHMDGNKKVGSGSVSGPGIFAARWHSLLDDTPITPITPTGPIRHGRDVKNSKAIGKTDATTGSEAWDPSTISRKEEDARPQPPNVSVIVELFGPDFKRLVADISSRRQTGVNS
ncbi:hypothetical protein F4778DRAFT_426369 [Xylariomycetidae sp. FL2044]|nr:hypothetical protein F4778DRAFT_426369 [Xylariomycetidae sp. FL2044]